MKNSDKIANEMLILIAWNNLYSSSIFVASSDENRTSVKVTKQWDLPLTINISLNGCEWKIT